MSDRRLPAAAVAALGLVGIGAATGEAEAAYFSLEFSELIVDEQASGGSGGFTTFSATENPSENGIEATASANNPPFLSETGDALLYALLFGQITESPGTRSVSPPIQPGEYIEITLRLTAEFDGLLTFDNASFNAELPGLGVDPSRGDDGGEGDDDFLFASETDDVQIASGQTFELVMQTNEATVSGYGEWVFTAFINWESDPVRGGLPLEMTFDYSVDIAVLPTPGAAGLLAMGGLAALRRRRG
jgi:hypothetical protein